MKQQFAQIILQPLNPLKKKIEFEMDSMEKAKTAMEAKNYTDAIEHLNDVIKEHASDTNVQIAYRNLGTAYGILGEYEKALDSLNVAVEMSEADVFALSNRAMAHKDLGNFESAIADSMKAINLSEGKILAPYYCLAEVNLKIGNQEKAMEHYLTAYGVAEKNNQVEAMKFIRDRISHVGFISNLSPLAEKLRDIFSAQ